MSESDIHQPVPAAPDDAPTRCGYVAIIGRPNVGKSTLLNHLLGQKLSITSRRPQTTRHTVLGIKTEGRAQAIYVDTPGIHSDQKKAINRHMNRAATSVISDVDVIVFIVERLKWSDQDELVLQHLQQQKPKAPVILAINKVDQLEDKEQLLPHISRVAALYPFAAVVPLSALRGNNIDVLESAILSRLPEGVFFFPEDQITDRTNRFFAAELIREKVMRQLGGELPYQIAVEIERYKIERSILFIDATILVERDGQKAIVIGGGGQRLRQIGTDARKDMERMFDQKVMLTLWVKVKRGWSDDERALKSLGFDER
jgi:GTPase